MTDERFSRTVRLIGEDAVEKRNNASVAIFGVGGVGSFVCEALARAGIGRFLLVDGDTVDVTNINRQIHAMTSTIGKPKTAVMAARIVDINPAAKVTRMDRRYLPYVADEFFGDDFDYDYVVDAVDTVAAKISLAVECERRGIPIISAMGAGNKLDPTRFEVADIYNTSVCPLAKVMRHELKKRGVKSLKVVYSTEPPRSPIIGDSEKGSRKIAPASISFVPSVAGLIIASEVIKDITGIR